MRYVAILASILGLAACTSPWKSLNPKRDSYQTWEEIQPPGAVCSDNSQYKIWANYSNTSDNLVVVFEPGGACWDYPSCSGAAGIRGAANTNGLPDDHYTLAPFISPFLNRGDDTSPSQNWNMVYVPYCTGDVHTGNVVATYTDTASGQSLEFHHEGHNDVQAVVQWIDQNFTHVPKMLVTGCSAGGVGAVVNYAYLRRGVRAAQKSYLLDDAGPVYPDVPNMSFSTPLHQKIRSSWNLDSIGDLPSGFTFSDMGTLNTALADEFPHDRLAITYFERDHIFSDYSYGRFYTPAPDTQQEMMMWATDTANLTAEFAQRKNLYYYIPYYRDVNSSHCTTVINFAGSDFRDGSMTGAQWFNDLVDDKPIQSMIEPPQPGVDPTP